MKSYKFNKNILIISDSYVPQKISAAGMIYNLSQEILARKINVTCAFSGKMSKEIIREYNLNNINLVNTTIFCEFRDRSVIFRFIFEFSTAIVLAIKCYFYFKKKKDLDLIIWYGPSSFLWFVVKTINFSKKIPVYYILRDIFPDWLISLKIIKNPLIIWFLNKLSFTQYTVSDVIGVEAFENIDYLNKKVKLKKIEYLPNWPNIVLSRDNKIDDFVKYDFNNSVKLAHKSHTIKLVYTGNTSLAHDYKSTIEFLNKIYKLYKLQINLFSKLPKFSIANNNQIEQKYWGLVQDYNLPYIFSKMDCGVVSLNRFSKTNNIPGKFVSYTQFGLPIICFARINSSLAKLIINYDCGIVIDLSQKHKKNIINFSYFLYNFNKNKKYYSQNSKKLFFENYDTKFIANKILKVL